MEFSSRHEQGKIKRLLAIHIPVMDLKASVTWYTDHFGLTLLQLNGSTAELAVVLQVWVLCCARIWFLSVPQ
jgi:catechol 2,3-dioxygenase-like lactoylglutathione lyase family enzyme